ncbi:HipA domain-containing protein [Rheinheimera sp. UJ63]|nr:HipA domain-containing protein [Rheinheimera sp. UJ63]
MRSQILFWLLGATDGHAKNFSIFLEQQDQYWLTPLYDILSAFTAISKKVYMKKTYAWQCHLSIFIRESGFI